MELQNLMNPLLIPKRYRVIIQSSTNPMKLQSAYEQVLSLPVIRGLVWIRKRKKKKKKAGF